jgi:predicted glycoside hydrolase/deacetylase ChbG (UPF0249 family)
MAPTLAERLGFEATDRVAVVHCDDIGFCQAANQGAFEALGSGPASCGSVMVPCPRFDEAAARAKASPDVDLGVHLTLNCEYDSYRWGPLLGTSAVPSLVDCDGGFPRTSAEVVARAQPVEVEAELRAQIERALEAGIDVTHLDAHMGTALMPPFVAIYARLVREFRLAAFLVRPDPDALAALSVEGATLYEELLAELEADGIPVFDGFDANSLHFEPGRGEMHNRARLAALPPGVSYLICHPARDGEELSAITETAHMRDFERRFYGGEPGRRALEEEGIRTVGMRPLRDLVRGHVGVGEI